MRLSLALAAGIVFAGVMLLTLTFQSGVPTGLAGPGPTATTTPRPCSGGTPPIPANDDFADSISVGSLPFTDSVSTACATDETNEPHPCESIGSTVWYDYTPSTSQHITANTAGSNFPAVLAVYTGTTLSSLTSISCDLAFFEFPASVSFQANAGTTYHFQLGGYGGLGGELVFNLSVDPATPTPTMTPTPCPAGKVPFGGECGTPTMTPTPACPPGKVPTFPGCGTPRPTSTPCPTGKVPHVPGCATPTPTRTPTPTITPAPGLDFSLGIDTNGDTVDDCGTRPSQSTQCYLGPGTTFRLHVYLNSLPVVLTGYAGFDLVLDHTGVTSHNNPDANVWPDCVYEAFFFFDEPASVAWGCVTSPHNLSTFTGLVGTIDFTCTTDGSLALNHSGAKTGVTGGEPDLISYREAGPDALNVHCAQAIATVTPQSVGGSALDTSVGQHPLRTGDGGGARELALAFGLAIACCCAVLWFARMLARRAQLG